MTSERPRPSPSISPPNDTGEAMGRFAMAASSPTVARVLRGELCAGCGLCVGVSGGALRLETVAPGYSRPAAIRPLSPEAEASVAAACPGITVAPWQPAPNRHAMWGPYVRCMAGHATDADIRHKASSGGGISALLIHAIATGMVDRVLHVEADPVYPTRNRVKWSRTANDIIHGAGSRYAASSPLEAIDDALSEGGSFAFVGKPCDVSALRQLATVDPRVKAHVPLMLSFYCAGLPSHAGAARILAKMGFAPGEVRHFRYRGFGWPGLTRAETQDGRVGEMRYADSWGGELSKEVQFRCKICPDAVGGVADIACADAWYGGESGYPQFEEQGGRSLIMSRTSTGDALLQQAIEAGAVAAEPLAVGEIDLMQPGQARRKRLVAARLAACRTLFQPVPKMAGLDIANAARQAAPRETVQNWLGTVRRILRKQR
ncbi:MAG: Coenzyme F420 hydrogenase/dehydrogenase, beta subunit C-terminal domain [Sphingomonas sp.]